MADLLAKRVAGFGTSVFTEMSRLAVEHQAVNLGQGFPDFPGPDFVKEAAIQAIRADQNQYAVSHGALRLRCAIAETWQRNHGRAVDPDTEVSVGSGPTEVKDYASNRSRILVVWQDMTELESRIERAFLGAEVAPAISWLLRTSEIGGHSL